MRYINSDHPSSVVVWNKANKADPTLSKEVNP